MWWLMCFDCYFVLVLLQVRQYSMYLEIAFLAKLKQLLFNWKCVVLFFNLPITFPISITLYLRCITLDNHDIDKNTIIQLHKQKKLSQNYNVDSPRLLIVLEYIYKSDNT